MAQLSLLLIPLLLFVSTGVLKQQQGPYWLGSNLDPEYAYLLNALSIATFHAPQHTDHPGTPVQMLGAVVLRLAYLGQSLVGPAEGAFVETVLQHPESFLTWINLVLLLLAAACILGIGWLTLALSGSVCLSLLLQVSPFLTLANFTALGRVSPEPLLFSIGQGLVMLLVAFGLRPTLAANRWFPLLLGGGLGLGVATKVTCLPLALLILILPTLRQKLGAIGSLVGAFVLGTLPIVTQYPRVLGWLMAIATRTGSYGTGSQGILAPARLEGNLLTLVTQEPTFFVLLACSTVTYGGLVVSQRLLPRKTGSNNDLHLLGLGLLISWLQVLLTLKQPEPRYLLPAMGLSGWLIFLQVRLLARVLPSLTPWRHGRILPWVVLFLCLSLNSVQILNTIRSASHSYSEVQQLQTLIQSKYGNCLQFSYYRSSSMEYGLKFGNDVLGGRFAESLQKLYPQAAFYNIWARRFETYSQQLILPSDLPQRACLILRGSPFTGENARFHPSANLEQLTPGSTETLYRVLAFP